MTKKERVHIADEWIFAWLKHITELCDFGDVAAQMGCTWAEAVSLFQERTKLLHSMMMEREDAK